jgi:hypothetical protein
LTHDPEDAVETLSKNLVVPLLEKMLADGTILEYEVDTLAIHTEAPGDFWISYIVPKPEGLDKVEAAVREALKSQPLSGPAFGSMTVSSAHRDELINGDGIYKWSMHCFPISEWSTARGSAYKN